MEYRLSMHGFAFVTLFDDQSRFEQHGNHKDTQGQDAQGDADLHPARRIVHDLAHGRRHQSWHDQTQAFFDPDADKKQDTGWEHYLVVVPTGIEGQDQGAGQVHADC